VAPRVGSSQCQSETHHFSAGIGTDSVLNGSNVMELRPHWLHWTWDLQDNHDDDDDGGVLEDD